MSGRKSFLRVASTATAVLVLVLAGGIAMASPGSKHPAAKTAASAQSNLVDINSASKAELSALPGIGDAYASKIIAGRPYRSKADLKTRHILPNATYEKIHDKIIATQSKKK